MSVAVISSESADPADRAAVAELAAHLVAGSDLDDLSGAELCAGSGWLGLRSHPAPTGSVNFGGPEVPDWVGAAVRDLVGDAPATNDER